MRHARLLCKTHQFAMGMQSKYTWVNEEGGGVREKKVACWKKISGLSFFPAKIDTVITPEKNVSTTAGLFFVAKLTAVQCVCQPHRGFFSCRSIPEKRVNQQIPLPRVEEFEF